MHVQDVAFVIHQLNLHAFNVNRSKIDAFVGLQRRTKHNVGLSGLEIEGFHRNERENVGRCGPRVAVSIGISNNVAAPENTKTNHNKNNKW